MLLWCAFLCFPVCILKFIKMILITFSEYADNGMGAGDLILVVTGSVSGFRNF